MKDERKESSQEIPEAKERFYEESDIVKIIDIHTDAAGRLDDDVSRILEEISSYKRVKQLKEETIPNYSIEQNCDLINKEVKRYIDSTEFQTKVLDYIGSEEFNKMFNATYFKDNQDCKNAVIHGMCIASMLTCRCDALYLKR